MWYILSWTFTFLLISDLQIVTEVSHDSSDTVFLSTRVQFGFHFHLQGVQLWIEEPNKWSGYLGLLPASHEARLWWNCSGSVTFGSSIADKGERHATKAAVVKTRAGRQPARGTTRCGTQVARTRAAVREAPAAADVLSSGIPCFLKAQEGSQEEPRLLSHRAAWAQTPCSAMVQHCTWTCSSRCKVF